MTVSELLETANEQYRLKNPFVLYRKPEANTIHLLIQQGGEHYKNFDFSERGFIMAPFDPSASAVLLRPDHHYTASWLPVDTEPDTFEPKAYTDSAEQIRYLKLVEKALEEIRSGSLLKAVVSRCIELPYEKLPLHAFLKLLNAHEYAFCYFWFHPEIGLWIGASPELLLWSDGKIIRTNSLAGTKPVVVNEAPPWSSKEVEEQEIVTDYIKEQFELLGLEYKATKPSSSRAGKLWHLKTEISAVLGDSGIQNIINALHPTPAVCGLPKKEAVEFLLESENYDRKFYTGFLGEINMEGDGYCELYVNLRCMEWVDNKARIYVGGGITKQSEPASEWQETYHKSQTVINALFNYVK